MPATPESSDRVAETDEEIFLEADRRLRISIEANGANVTNAIEALEFEDGNHWPMDLKNQRKLTNRPTLTINHTRTFVRRVVNNMRQQRPRIKVHPTGGGARVEDAKILSGLIRHVETRSKASVAYDGAGESSVKIGWGYARVVSEYESEDSFQQELKILAIRNPFTVYDDPAAQLPTAADREWCLISEEMQRSEYRRKYPKAENAEWRRGGPGDNDRLWESKEKIRLAEYFRIRYKAATLYRLSDGSGVFQEDWGRKPESYQSKGLTLLMDGDTPVSRVSARRSIEWFRLNGRRVVEKQTLPGHWVPVVRCLGNVLDLNGQIRYCGMVKDLMDSNRMLDYWASCETEIVALAPRARFRAAEGQLDGHPEWNDYNQKPYKALIYKVVHTNPDDQNSPPLPPPEMIPGMEVPAAIINARQGAEHDMMALAGMPHEPGQDKAGEVVSGKALRQRQALSDIGHFQYYDNQTQFIAHIGEILVDYIPYYYSEARMQRIIGEDGVPQMVGINQPTMSTGPQGEAIHEIKNDLTVGKFDVVMDTGPGYETKRQEGVESMLDLLRTELGKQIAQVGSDLIVRNMDFAGADDLADRLMALNPQAMQKALASLPKEAQAMIGSLMQQINQLKQALQQAQLELKFKGDIEKGWMAVEREKAGLTAKTKVHDTETRADAQITVAHIGALEARDVAEIRGATQLLNTNTEAAHDRRAARDMIEHAQQAENRPNGAA